MRVVGSAVLLAAVLLAAPAQARSAEPETPATREAELEALRMKKAQTAKPDHRNVVEKALIWIHEKRVIERLSTPGAGFHGIRPKIGGLSTGSGFGFGFQYDRLRLASGSLDLSFTAAASGRAYETYDLRAAMPRLGGGKLAMMAQARYRRMPQEDFFGIGIDTHNEDRTDFLYEDAAIGITGALRPVEHLSISASVDRITVNVGPGTDSHFPNTENAFSDDSAPGIDMQPTFRRIGVSVAVDTRDFPGNPRSGFYARAGLESFEDGDLEQFDFTRKEAELQAYLPFNYGHRVFAARLAGTFDSPRTGSRIPFYMMKPLGGAGDLRGFREFRFRDENQVVLNVEYRWEAWIGLDMAIFADFGQVFRNTSDLSADTLASDYGFGVRFNSERAVFLRIDIARSVEGTRAFFKFEHVF